MLRTGTVEAHDLTQGALGDSLSGGESDTQPSNREADTTTELLPTQRNLVTIA